MNVKIKLSDTLRPLLGALLLSSVAFTSLVEAQVRPLDRIVAIVDNDVVMQSQLDERLREVQQNMQRSGAQLPPPTSCSSRFLSA